MESNNHTLDIFAFIGATHEFAPMIQEFRETIRSAPQFAPFAARSGSADCDVHADQKAQRPHSGQWTLHRGDPLDSAAMCDAEEAYLTGYAQFAGEPIDRKRLRWFRTCAEIHHLALSLKKDAWSAVGFESTVDAVVASAARLGKAPA